jgi:hypothetical protein
MSCGGYQRPIIKVPDDFSWAVVQLIKWRDSVKDRRKAAAIQRVIDKKIQWARDHHMNQSLYMFCVGNGYDLYGKNWGNDAFS